MGLTSMLWRFRMLLFKLDPEIKDGLLFMLLGFTAILLALGIVLYVGIIEQAYTAMSQSCELLGNKVSCNIVQFKK